MQLIINTKISKFYSIKYNIIKGVLYGKNFKNIKIEIRDNNYYINLKTNLIVKLKLVNKLYKTKIKDIKYHIYKKKILHIDFLLI